MSTRGAETATHMQAQDWGLNNKLVVRARMICLLTGWQQSNYMLPIYHNYNHGATTVNPSYGSSNSST